ncbi:hypothetical protein K6Y31_04860 [Motilimonas cestriensis]|uniref:Uncharacterized protein n=1 Tax=Motilimonas cestriensis TaxID=2742685 RepID=A0ABS8W9S1_9GAMM|nr:hypothetical protein [Motilimonas cestriensis]MCE2594140.1 hypothetical protein [Motilimonas cestriensis]
MRKNKTLLLLLLVFVLPFGLAKLVLNQHWYQAGELNKGEFLPEQVMLLLSDNRQWLLLHPKTDQATNLLPKLISSLGREQHRVRTLSIAQLSKREQDKLSPDYWYICDPTGLVLLRYVIPPQQAEQLQVAKALQTDLRKLLKMSRVG